MSRSCLLLAASVLVLSACQPAVDAPEELVVETPPVVEDVVASDDSDTVEIAAEDAAADAAVVEVAAQPEAEDTHDHDGDHDHGDDGHDHEEDHDHGHDEDHDHGDDHDHDHSDDHDHGDGHDHGGGEAHVHGLSDLAATLDGSTLTISIEGAMANFDLDETLREISDPDTYAAGTVEVVGGACTQSSSDVSVRPIQEHGNLMIDLTYECGDVGALEAIEVTGFTTFAGFEEVNAVYLTESGQTAETLTASDTRLDLN